MRRGQYNVGPCEQYRVAAQILSIDMEVSKLDALALDQSLAEFEGSEPDERIGQVVLFRWFQDGASRDRTKQFTRNCQSPQGLCSRLVAAQDWTA